MSRGYIRHSVASLEQILPLIPSEDKVLVNGEFVNAKSLRLQNFKKNLTCCACGLTASFFAVERSNEPKSGRRTSYAFEGNAHHLNLYGVKDGKEILFTHDHILARSLGGDDSQGNTQTMCAPCNFSKGRQEFKQLKEKSKTRTDDGAYVYDLPTNKEKIRKRISKKKFSLPDLCLLEAKLKVEDIAKEFPEVLKGQFGITDEDDVSLFTYQISSGVLRNGIFKFWSETFGYGQEMPLHALAFVRYLSQKLDTFRIDQYNKKKEAE